ncbi:MAG: PLP-dependent aminotransferase family protein [Leptospiraceae bacterium]|nr:PLP-dependent aminotransferase family protein [Leptospiraceae bacterium]
MQKGKVKVDGRPMILARRMISGMENGEYPPGSRLPSIRQSIRLSGFSQGTVVEAYRILLDKGLIQSVPGGGYYASASSEGAPRPQKSRILSRLSLDPALDRALNTGAKKILASFGLAVPSEDLLPLSSIKGCITEALRTENVHGYSFPPGLPDLRKEIGRRYLQNGVAADWEEILLTGSATEAAYLVLQELVQPGDLVALESPCYSGFLFQIRKFDLKFLEIPVNADDGMDVDALEKHLRSGRRIRMLITVPNFHNPTGALLSEAKRERLLSLAQKYRFYILEDDVYGGIHHGLKRSPPMAARNRERVFLVSSFAKSIAPSMRLGWVIAPPEFQEKLLQRFRSMSLGNSRLTETALSLFLKKGKFDRHLRRLRKETMQRMTEFRNRILQWPTDIRLSSPVGGFWLWVELPVSCDALKIQQEALEKGITISPGSLFSPSGGYRNYLRINCALPAGEKTLKHLDTIGSLVASQLDERQG